MKLLYIYKSINDQIYLDSFKWSKPIYNTPWM